MGRQRKVLVSDFDGTLACLTLPAPIYELVSQYRLWLVPLIFFCPAVFLFYLLRPSKKSAVSIVREHKASGGQVIVFSANENIFLARWLVATYLRFRRIPFDKLILRPHGLTSPEFKAKVSEEEGCDILLEDELKLISVIAAHKAKTGQGAGEMNIKRISGFYKVVFFGPPNCSLEALF